MHLPAVTPSLAAVPKYRFLAWHDDGSEQDLLCERFGCFRVRPQILWQLISPPKTEESVECLALETLRELVSEDQIVLRNQAISLVVPLILDIEVTS